MDTLISQSTQPTATHTQDTQETTTQPTAKAKKQKPKELFVSCVKFQYIHDIPYKFKDSYGYTHIAEKDNIVIVPKGSLERHLKARKGLFTLIKG